MDKLPTEVLWLVCGYLSRQERIELRLVNQHFRHAMAMQVWAKLWFGQWSDQTNKQGWSVIDSITTFNMVLEHVGAEIDCVKHIHIASVISELAVDFTNFGGLKILDIELQDPVMIPIGGILKSTQHVPERNLKYVGRLGSGWGAINHGMFSGETFNSLEIETTSDLPRCLAALTSSPKLAPISKFVVKCKQPHYADIMAKVLGESQVSTLVIDMPVVNPFNVPWIPDSVTDLSIGRGVIGPGQAQKVTCQRLTVLDPDTTLQTIIPQQPLEILRLDDSRSNARDEEDVEGQFYSEKERLIAKSVDTSFLPVKKLHCVGLSLGLAAHFCQSVQQLIIERPKTSADTTFTNFNGMLTRLAHHNMDLLIPHCGNLTFLYIDRFFQLAVSTDDGLAFLSRLLGKCPQLETLLIADDKELVGWVDRPNFQYGDCLTVVEFDQHMSQVSGRVTFRVDLKRLRETMDVRRATVI